MNLPTSDGPPPLHPVVVCPACRARVSLFTQYTDDRPRYAVHAAKTGYNCGRTCEQSGEVVKPEGGNP